MDPHPVSADLWAVFEEARRTPWGDAMDIKSFIPGTVLTVVVHAEDIDGAVVAAAWYIGRSPAVQMSGWKTPVIYEERVVLEEGMRVLVWDAREADRAFGSVYTLYVAEF
jgi:hypothetical protein